MKKAPTPTNRDNSDLKLERNNLASRINNLRAELEVTKSEIKKELEYLKNLVRDSKNNSKKLEKINATISSANDSLEEVKNRIRKECKEFEVLELKTEQEKKEAIDKASIELERTRAEIKPIKDELKSLDKAKEKETKEFGKLSAINEDLRDVINGLKIDKELKVSELSRVTDDVVKGTIIAKSLIEKIKDVKKVEVQLDDVNKKLCSSLNDRRKVEKDIVIMKKENKELDVKKADILSGITKGEKELGLMNRRERSINLREVELNKEEKRINKLGSTLQKHFDDNDMKHIKVFKQNKNG